MLAKLFNENKIKEIRFSFHSGNDWVVVNPYTTSISVSHDNMLSEIMTIGGYAESIRAPSTVEVDVSFIADSMNFIKNGENEVDSVSEILLDLALNSRLNKLTAKDVKRITSLPGWKDRFLVFLLAIMVEDETVTLYDLFPELEED